MQQRLLHLRLIPHDVKRIYTANTAFGRYFALSAIIPHSPTRYHNGIRLNIVRFARKLLHCKLREYSADGEAGKSGKKAVVAAAAVSDTVAAFIDGKRRNDAYGFGKVRDAFANLGIRLRNTVA